MSQMPPSTFRLLTHQATPELFRSPNTDTEKKSNAVDSTLRAEDINKAGFDDKNGPPTYEHGSPLPPNYEDSSSENLVGNAPDQVRVTHHLEEGFLSKTDDEGNMSEWSQSSAGKSHMEICPVCLGVVPTPLRGARNATFVSKKSKMGNGRLSGQNAARSLDGEVLGKKLRICSGCPFPSGTLSSENNGESAQSSPKDCGPAGSRVKDDELGDEWFEIVSEVPRVPPLIPQKRRTLKVSVRLWKELSTTCEAWGETGWTRELLAYTGDCMDKVLGGSWQMA